MATVIKTTGMQLELHPQNGTKSFQKTELTSIIGSFQSVRIASGIYLLCDYIRDENPLVYNPTATHLLRLNKGYEDASVIGDAIVACEGEIKGDE